MRRPLAFLNYTYVCVRAAVSLCFIFRLRSAGVTSIFNRVLFWRARVQRETRYTIEKRRILSRTKEENVLR